jgi:hypothetical protein
MRFDIEGRRRECVRRDGLNRFDRIERQAEYVMNVG